MPANPLERSFIPGSDIDLSLFAHIHDDPFLTGTSKLQGNLFKRTIAYLDRYCDSISVGKPLLGEVSALKKRIHKLVDIELELERIRGLPSSLPSPDIAKVALTSLSNLIANNISLLKNNTYLSMPGGWLTPSGGHAMVYQFKRTSEGLEFYIYNAGAGIEYHERQSAFDRELYYPIQAYRIPLTIPFDLKKLAGFLHELMLPMLPRLRSPQAQSFDEKQLYEEVFSRLSFLNASQFSVANGAVHALTAGQLSGTCAQRALHQMLKENFKTLAAYQHFIYQFKRYALDDFITVLNREHLLHDERAQTQIRHAINTMLRTLNTPNLFRRDDIDKERVALRAHRALLARHRVKGASAAPLKTIPQTALELTFKIDALVEPLRRSNPPPVAYPPAVLIPFKPIVGGRGLLAQLQELSRDCERLKIAGQYTSIIERLEAVFANFPLPSVAQGFGHVLDYYQGIDCDNQTEFYKIIALLQSRYLDACSAQSSNAALPRMLVTGISTVSVLDYVMYKVGSPAFHHVARDMLGQLFEKNQSNPYFATNNPVLDERLLFIKSLYPLLKQSDLISNYTRIIDSEPTLKAQLLVRYKPPLDAVFARLLTEGGLKELYCLLTDVNELTKIAAFQPLIKKFDDEHLVEQCALRGLQTLWSSTSSINQRVELYPVTSNDVTYIGVRSVAAGIMSGSNSDLLTKHKYGLSNDLASQHALALDSQVTASTKNRRDNHIQLFPSDVVSHSFDELDIKTRASLVGRQINKFTINDREFVHLRSSSRNQFKLTLDYFQRHLAKLSDKSCQIYMEANLFEPGLLSAELNKNPNILKQFDRFIDAGLKYYAARGFTSQSSLFFIRLAYLVNRYTALYNPDLAHGRLQALQQRLIVLLQLNKENDASIKQSLHQYQFLTVMARVKLKPGSVRLEELSSYFYMKANYNPHAFFDTASQFDLECITQDFKLFVAHAKPEQINQFIHDAMEHLGLGVCLETTKTASSLYAIRMQQGDHQLQYTVDVGRGLVFNASGMAYTFVPLDILHHQVMRFLSPKRLEPCFTSSDGLLFEIGEPELRFIRQTKNSTYRVQKKWTVGGHTQWYELHDLNSEQHKAYGLDSQTITLPVPAIMKQRDTQIWVGCGDPKNLLITENNRPTYRCMKSTSRQWKVNQLNEDGVENGFTLCTGITWIHDFFATFEDVAFITVCQHADGLQVKFGRYGLTLLASQESGVWVFRLEGDPHYTLVGDVTTLLPGVVGLIFLDKTTKKSMCYLPVQSFVCTDTPLPQGVFHHLQQDIAARIPRVEVDKLTNGSTGDLLPWQYSASERVIRYQLDSGGSPVADTVCSALYLCYVYLGSQHPEKAWAVLDDCAKRLGGSVGSIDELTLLNLIINAVPRKLKDSDSEFTISTPAYVVCQLKALALLTSAFTPGKTIIFGPKTFDVKTPDGLYQEKRWKELQAFYNGLNNTVYKLYSRFQTMQRHLEYGFDLADDERQSLLDYYHFNLPGAEPKAVGALGYEWQELRLKTIKKEYEALHAEKLFNGALPAGYQKRLEEIEQFLTEETTVRAHHTEVVSLPIDLSLPLSMKGGSYSFGPGIYSIIKSWVDDINRASTFGDIELLDALTPEMTEAQLYRYFPAYFQLALTPLVSHAQTKLLDFCRQYLIAHRHTPLDKQESKTTYLFNILYRIAKNRGALTEVLSNGQVIRLVDILYFAQQLPDPTLAIFQARHITTKALAGTNDIWASLEDNVPAPGKPMVAAPCVSLTQFNADAMLRASGLNTDFKGRLRQSAKHYRAQAAIVGAAPAIVAIDEPESQVLSFADRQAGVAQYDALQAMKTIASEMLDSSPTRDALQKTAQSFANKLGTELGLQLEAILRLANAGPADVTQKQRHDLELESGVRSPMDLSRLLALYFKADKAKYAVETGLSAEQINELHTKLSHYLQHSVRQQALQRFCKQIKDAGATPEPSTLQQIAHEWLTDDQVDYKTEPVLAMLQYYENILLRPQQMAAIKRLLARPDQYAFFEAVEKIIMGGGKSKVMLPVLAQCKATGNNLVVIEVPDALFETNCADLAATSHRLFNQKACPFEFNRDSDCTPESLQFLYAKLNQIIVNKDYIVTTGDAVQSLELKYLELLFQCPEDVKQQERWAKQVEGLDNIISLFRTRADVVMDEVHQALLLKKKLNYTLGERLALSTNIITECVELYHFFEQVSLVDVLGEAFVGKSLASLLENNQLITKDESWKAVMTHLTNALIHHPASPLKHILQRVEPKLTDGDKDELYRYLMNESTSIPVCVRASNSKTQTIFALYKEQLSQLLPQTLKRKLNEHYGASKQRVGDGLAIPYVANNIPNERSRFGNYLEAINYSIQMLMIKGFCPVLLKQYLLKLQEQARQELFNDPVLGVIDNTPIARGFQALVPGFVFTLSQLHLDDSDQFNLVFNALRKNKNLICDVLKTDVLPQIHVESEILHSDAYNHVDIYRSCQGVTGTPSNSSTYHQRLVYHKKTAAATDGFILKLLEEKNTVIRQVSNTTPAAYLDGLFKDKKAHESVRAIIDICAAFKGISNVDVAIALAKYVHEHPAQFSTPVDLKYILFFNEDNVLCALDIKDGSLPVPIGSTDPKVIDATWGTPDQRFCYYDQAHTVGVDLKQGIRAKALVLVDYETPLQRYLQGASRFRGLQDEQSIEIIVPDNCDVTSHESLVLHMAANEERQLQQDNFAAAQAKMTNLIRADFMRRLLALPSHEVLKKHRYALAFKAYFVEEASHDFFMLYGGIVSTRGAKVILEEQRQRLLSDWSRIIKSIDDEAVDQGLLEMTNNLNQIIAGALPFCQATYLSPTRQEHGKEVEVQKQVQIELQHQLQQEREYFNVLLEPTPYTSWEDVPLPTHYSGAAGFLSLTALCSRRDAKAPEFGHIYVGRNYYQTYVDQTQFIGVFLKPVHALLFRMRADGTLDCLILSQREAEEWTSILDKNKNLTCWLSTTQHTLLAGHPPAEIEENESYQDIIEKVRFFNGEINLLLASDLPHDWLSEGTGQKLDFFERNLLPYRETEHKDMVVLRQVLSHRQKAFQYIAKHPMEDYTSFEWRVQINEELSDADIDECETLAQAFANANSHWRDKGLSRKKCQEGLRLSLQASSYINRYIDEQLMILRGIVPLCEEGHEDALKSILDSLLPALIKDYLPGVLPSLQSLLQFILQKASIADDSSALLDVADYLVLQKGDIIHEKNMDCLSPLELVILDGGDFVLEPVKWLLKKGARAQVNQEIWLKVAPKTMEQFFSVPVFCESEPFLLACVSVFKDDEINLRSIIECNNLSRRIFRKIIEELQHPTEDFLSILLAHDLVKTDTSLVQQLLQKAEGESRQWMLSRLLSMPNMKPAMFAIIIENKGDFNLKIHQKIVNDHADKLNEKLLTAMVSALPRDWHERPSDTFINLLNSILNHKEANAAVVDAVAVYMLPFELRFKSNLFGLSHDKLCKNKLYMLVQDLLQHEPQSIQAIGQLQKIVALVPTDTVVLEAAAHYALDVDFQYTENFWYDVARRRWDTLSFNVLCQMFLTLPVAVIDRLFQSVIFNFHNQSIINKFIQGAEPQLLNLLLQQAQVELESTQLMAFLAALDSLSVQVILPQVAAHPAADTVVLRQIIEVMKEPVDEVLKVLLVTHHFITNTQLVKHVLETIDDNKRPWVVAALSNNPHTSPEVLAAIIEDDGEQDEPAVEPDVPPVVVGDIGDDDVPVIVPKISPEVPDIIFIDIKTAPTDYSFLFNCLASAAMVAGGALLVVGIFALNPLLAAIGFGIAATVLVGAALSQYGLFCCKPTDPPEGLGHGLQL